MAAGGELSAVLSRDFGSSGLRSCIPGIQAQRNLRQMSRMLGGLFEAAFCILTNVNLDKMSAKI